MIDLTQEAVVSLTEAAELLPRRRGGKKPHVATLYRWSLRGLRGVQLETIQVGGTACTSKEALQRFFDELSARRLSAASSEARPPRPGQISLAIASLHRRGILSQE